MNLEEYLWWYEMDSVFATIEFTIEDRQHTYMLHWDTAVEGWKNDLRDNNNSGNEEKEGD